MCAAYVVHAANYSSHFASNLPRKGRSTPAGFGSFWAPCPKWIPYQIPMRSLPVLLANHWLEQCWNTVTGSSCSTAMVTQKKGPHFASLDLIHLWLLWCYVGMWRVRYIGCVWWDAMCEPPEGQRSYKVTSNYTVLADHHLMPICFKQNQESNRKVVASLNMCSYKRNLVEDYKRQKYWESIGREERWCQNVSHAFK